MSENAVPKGFTQNVLGSTGSRRVMWPATPVDLSCQYRIASGLCYRCFRCRALTLVEAVFPEDAECSGEPAFQVVALFHFIGKGWHGGHLHLDFGFIGACFLGLRRLHLDGADGFGGCWGRHVEL